MIKKPSLFGIGVAIIGSILFPKPAIVNASPFDRLDDITINENTFKGKKTIDEKLAKDYKVLDAQESKLDSLCTRYASKDTPSLKVLIDGINSRYYIHKGSERASYSLNLASNLKNNSNNLSEEEKQTKLNAYILLHCIDHVLKNEEFKDTEESTGLVITGRKTKQDPKKYVITAGVKGNTEITIYLTKEDAEMIMKYSEIKEGMDYHRFVIGQQLRF